VPHTPQLNGVDKRNNITIVECAQSILKSKNITNGFLVEAIFITVYLKNQYEKKKLENKTPSGNLFDYKSTINHLKILGSI
jgi:hypothetical protein